jgi:hypothetical protein
MFWNLEIHSGENGEKLEGRYDAVIIKPKRFDVPTRHGSEFGFSAFNSSGLIERIGFATIDEDERVTTSIETMTFKGISIALLDEDSRTPQDEDREHVHGIFDPEAGLLRSLEVPELHRQWTLTTDLGNTARILAEYSETGNDAGLRYV